MPQVGIPILPAAAERLPTAASNYRKDWALRRASKTGWVSFANSC